MKMNHEQAMAKFRRVYPEFPPLSEAPPSPFAAMREANLTTGAQRDEYYAQWYAKEGERWYKCLDKTGNVYRLRNPAVDRWEQKDTGKPVKYSPRHLLGHIEDLTPTVSRGYDKPKEEHAPW